MEELDKIDWREFRASVNNVLTRSQYDLICQLHAKYYNHRFYKPCTCSPKTIKTWIAQLNDVYDGNRND